VPDEHLGINKAADGMHDERANPMTTFTTSGPTR
jgi:hypothetical protein